jgi:hypothetical protein
MPEWYEFLRRKLCLKVTKKNQVKTYGAPVFAPAYSDTVLEAKMCTNSNERSMYIRCMCSECAHFCIHKGWLLDQ